MTIENPRATVLTLPWRNASRKYMAGELSLYFAGTDRVEHFGFYSKAWKALAKENGQINSAYGARVEGKRLEYAIEQLVKNPDTKNAVVMLRDDSDLEEGLKDRCCTLYWHFHIKDGKLNMRVCMRSTDFWLGLPYDVFCFTRYMQYVRYRVNKVAGTDYALGVYTHQMLNVHVYEKHWEKVKEGAKYQYSFNSKKAYEFPEYDDRVDEQRTDYLEWENRWRNDQNQNDLVYLRERKFRPWWETLGSMIVNKMANEDLEAADAQWFSKAKHEAEYSTCIDRKVGCVLVGEDGKSFSVGHNTPIECNQACDDKEKRICNVTHAEIKALKHIKGFTPKTAYVTLYPCLPCRLAMEKAGVKDIRVIGFSHKGAGGDQVVKLYDPEYEGL